jgi:5,10-methylenetetrahydromethanopterin reductase
LNNHFQLGLLLDSGGNVNKSIELAVLAEKNGYETVWANGNILSRDPVTVLSMIASRTTRVQLGSNVLDAYMRHPMTIASSLATLNDGSNGRAILGLGTAYPDALNKIGLERAIPLTRCREIIQLVRALQGGETVTFAGRAFNFKNAKLGYETSGRVPIYLGTGQGPNILRLAGELCEGAIMSETTDEKYAERVSLIREGRSKAYEQRNFNIILDIMVSVGKTRMEAVDALRPWMKTRIGKKSGAVNVIGLTPELAEKYVDDPSSIPEEYIQKFAVCGTLDECLDRIQSLEKLGITGIAHRYPTEKGVKDVSAALIPALATNL